MVEKSRIGRAELRVLEYVADHHPIPVAEVAKHFSQTAQLARTTILTVMEQLRRKGFLTRRKIGGIYHYAPKTSKSEILQAVVSDFVEGALGGSVSPFVAYLLERAELTDAQLQELRKLVRELDQKRKGEKS
jgi:predicted transcriptional regulator